MKNLIFVLIFFFTYSNLYGHSSLPWKITVKANETQPDSNNRFNIDFEVLCLDTAYWNMTIVPVSEKYSYYIPEVSSDWLASGDSIALDSGIFNTGDTISFSYNVTYDSSLTPYTYTEVNFYFLDSSNIN